MKLNADTLYEILSKKYSVEYKKGTNYRKKIARPMFYGNDQSDEQNLYILSKGQEIRNPGVYMCFEDTTIYPVKNVTCIVLPDHTNIPVLFNELTHLFNTFDEWERELSQIIENQGSFKDLIVCTHKYFHLTLSLTDQHFSVIALASDRPGDYVFTENNSRLDSETVYQLVSNPHLNYLDYAEGVVAFDLDTSYRLYNFKNQGKLQGRLVMAADSSDYDGRDLLIMEKLVYYIQLLLKNYGSFSSAATGQSLLHNLLMSGLKGKALTIQEMNRIMQNTGWKSDHRFLLTYFMPAHRLSNKLHPAYLISQVEERWPGSCAVEYNEKVVMLLNLSIYGQDKLADFCQSLSYMIRDSLMIAGSSRVFNGTKEIENAFRQAVYAIEMGKKKSPTKWSYMFDDYALDYIQNNGVGAFKPEQICHPALLELLNHDRSKQTDFYRTLKVFFEEQFNTTHSAARLFIHRSTFIGRMERIEEMTKLNLADYDTMLYLALSFRILG